MNPHPLKISFAIIRKASSSSFVRFFLCPMSYSRNVADRIIYVDFAEPFSKSISIFEVWLSVNNHISSLFICQFVKVYIKLRTNVYLGCKHACFEKVIAFSTIGFCDLLVPLDVFSSPFLILFINIFFI